MIFFVLKDFIYLFFRERGREGARGRERSMCGCPSCAPNWGLAHNPGMCPDWELNQQPFGLQASTQSTELHQPGRNDWLLMKRAWTMHALKWGIYYRNFGSSYCLNKQVRLNFLQKPGTLKLDWS